MKNELLQRAQEMYGYLTNGLAGVNECNQSMRDGMIEELEDMLKYWNDLDVSEVMDSLNDFGYCISYQLFG